MMNLTHWLHVFQKPVTGTAFIRRYPALSWKHRIAANGGFDTASCSLPVTRAEGEYIFENFDGNRAALFVDNPIEPAWEGYISRITLTTPGVIFTRSLDEMGNRTVINQTGSTGSGIPTVPTTLNNAASQAIYGVKVKTIRAARAHAGALTYATSLATRALNDIAYPMTSAASNDGSSEAIIQLELKGFYYTLDWETALYAGGFPFRNGSTGHIDELLNNLANGTTFLNNLDVTDLTNNAITLTTVSDGATVWARMTMIAECGNNAQRWVIGIGNIDRNTGARRLYYRPADTTVKYVARANRPGLLYTTIGAPVLPWTARPDGNVLISDALVGWDGDGLDPRQSYLAALEYDADTGMLNWQSDDNIAIAGALQTNTWHTSSDMRYGQRASNPMM